MRAGCDELTWQRSSRRETSNPFSGAQPSLNDAILARMKVEEIAEAVAKLPPDQLARFRRWFTAFEAGRANHAEELPSAWTQPRRLPATAFREMRRRAKEP